MAKKKATVRLHLEVGKASPAPPVGPALAQHKVKNMMGFCKEFNAQTKDMEPGMKIPVDINIYDDGSVKFSLLAPTVSHMLFKAAGVAKGSEKAGRIKEVATVTLDQVMEIAANKMQDMNANTVEAAANIVKGSARSAGIIVTEAVEG